MKRLLLSASIAIAALFAVATSPVPARAADAPAKPAAPKATRIILLGTAGGPAVVPYRSEPANLLVVNGKPYLIDAGESVSRQLVLAGFKVGQLRNIFITHHHVDHNAGLPALMALQWFGWSLGKPQPPEQIYGPPATKFLVNTSLQYLSVSERIFRAGIPAMLPAKPMFVAHDIDRGGVVYKDADVTVTAAENTHFQFKSGSPETGQDRSYSYRFDTKNGSVVFTGDTGPSKAVERLARGADVLVSEVRLPMPNEKPIPVQKTPPKTVMGALFYHLQHEHLTPEEVGKLAHRAHVKVVILTHFSPSTAEDMSRFTAGVKKYFSGVVIPGKDFFEYDLD